MKNVKIDDAVFNAMKNTCEKYGLKIYSFASEAIVQLCIEWERANSSMPKIAQKPLEHYNIIKKSKKIHKMREK